MRKIESAGNALSTTSFNSRAEARSCPKGFSITTRRQPVVSSAVSPTRPDAFNCVVTRGKAFGGIER